LHENQSAYDKEARHIGRGKLATRLAFFVAGFGLACWAPLVPFAKERIGADSAQLGTVLLCLGLGALIGMPAAGALSARIGSRIVTVAGGVGMALAMPVLALAPDAVTLGLSLLLLGLSLGAIDVGANVHGIEVQHAAGVPLMSGFHGLYSIGGFVGVSAMTAAIAFGVSIVPATIAAAGLILLCMLVATPRFFATRSQEEHPLIVVPKGIVVLIGLLALVTYLVEGAVLDWGALLLTQIKQVDVKIAGTGYTVFALAMTVARLVGDRFVARIGEKQSLIGGALLTSVGIAIVALADPLWLSLAGLAVAGFGAANVVPILFSLAGRQKVMAPTHAVAAAAALGYLGILLGPALIGYVAHAIGLVLSFMLLSILMLVVAVLARLCVL
jgi:MFS family permease